MCFSISNLHNPALNIEIYSLKATSDLSQSGENSLMNRG